MMAARNENIKAKKSHSINALILLILPVLWPAGGRRVTGFDKARKRPGVARDEVLTVLAVWLFGGDPAILDPAHDG